MNKTESISSCVPYDRSDTHARAALSLSTFADMQRRHWSNPLSLYGTSLPSIVKKIRNGVRIYLSKRSRTGILQYFVKIDKNHKGMTNIEIISYTGNV